MDLFFRPWWLCDHENKPNISSLLSRRIFFSSLDSCSAKSTRLLNDNERRWLNEDLAADIHGWWQGPVSSQISMEDFRPGGMSCFAGIWSLLKGNITSLSWSDWSFSSKLERRCSENVLIAISMDLFFRPWWLCDHENKPNISSLLSRRIFFSSLDSCSAKSTRLLNDNERRCLNKELAVNTNGWWQGLVSSQITMEDFRPGGMSCFAGTQDESGEESFKASIQLAPSSSSWWLYMSCKDWHSPSDVRLRLSQGKIMFSVIWILPWISSLILCFLEFDT